MRRSKPRVYKRVKAATRLKSPRRRSAPTPKLRKRRKQSGRGSQKQKQRVGSSTRSRLEPEITKQGPKVVRIMGHGQYKVDMRTLKRLKQIDESLVEIVSQGKSDDVEFRRKLAELSDTTTKNGKPVDPKEIVRSDIILPTPDLGIDEAKKLFKGEGVIPAT